MDNKLQPPRIKKFIQDFLYPLLIQSMTERIPITYDVEGFLISFLHLCKDFVYPHFSHLALISGLIFKYIKRVRNNSIKQ